MSTDAASSPVDSGQADSGQVDSGRADSGQVDSGQARSRQAISYCPYCAEETLFPLEGGGWDCRSCQRAFSVKFLGLVAA